jgi:hypothetical protein
MHAQIYMILFAILIGNAYVKNRLRDRKVNYARTRCFPLKISLTCSFYFEKQPLVTKPNELEK